MAHGVKARVKRTKVDRMVRNVLPGRKAIEMKSRNLKRGLLRKKLQCVLKNWQKKMSEFPGIYLLQDCNPRSMTIDAYVHEFCWGFFGNDLFGRKISNRVLRY